MKFISVVKSAMFVLGVCISFAIYAGKPTYEYTVVEIKLPRSFELVHANAINELGDVVGVANKIGGGSSAFIYRSKSTIELGTLGGGSSTANDINLYGQVVGKYFLAGNSGPHAFLYDNDLMIDLHPILSGTSEAKSINSVGIIVGNNGSGATNGYAFIYDQNNGVMEDLNTFALTNKEWRLETAVSINNSNQIIGVVRGILNGESITRRYLFDNGNVSFIPLKVANHINDQGLVVGAASMSSGLHAAFSDSIFTRVIGAGIANESNNQGTIVGLGFDGLGQINNYAFVYDAENGMRNLNDLVKDKICCKLLNAVGINEAGQILVTGRKIKGDSVDFAEHAFVLTRTN